MKNIYILFSDIGNPPIAFSDRGTMEKWLDKYHPATKDKNFWHWEMVVVEDVE